MAYRNVLGWGWQWQFDPSGGASFFNSSSGNPLKNAFVQLWATRHGRDRVLAFTDSTVFSNFSTFEPGKIELLLGMLEWLNRRDTVGNPCLALLLIGLAVAVACARFTWKRAGVGGLALPAAAFGWALASLGVLLYQRVTFPEPKPVRPLVWVTIDRTLCDGPLSKGGFIAGKPDGPGIFERWILRLGYQPSWLARSAD